MVARIAAFAAELMFVAVPVRLAFGQCEDGWRYGFHLPGLDDHVHALAVFNDGGGPALYAGGEFRTADDKTVHGLARWDGGQWRPLDVGVGGVVAAMAVFDDGDGPCLYIGGSFSTAGGVAASNIAKWDGETFAPVGGGVDNVVLALATFGDDRGTALYAGGFFNTAGGQPVNRIAKWDGQNWSSLLGGVSGGGNTRVAALHVHDDGTGSNLLVGGVFTTAGGTPANHIARWDGQAFHPLGAGIGGDGVFAMETFDDGSGSALFVGGAFDSAGEIVTSCIAKWDGATWSGLGDGPGTGGLTPGVSALRAFGSESDPALYLGGFFTSVNDVPAERIARWNGESVEPLGAGFAGAPLPDDYPCVWALTVYDDGGGPAMYAGGYFDFADGIVANNIARYTPDGFAPVTTGGNGLNAWAHVAAVYDDGDGAALYVGGQFTAAGSTPANNIARWNGNTWTVLGDGTEGPVYALTVYDDGDGAALYVGGLFVTAGGLEANRIARWDGQAWSALGAGVSRESPYSLCKVEAITPFVDADGNTVLYVGGLFDYAGEMTASHLATWDGQSWAAVGGGTDNIVLSLTVATVDAGPSLYLGGQFSQAGGVAANSIARWDGESFYALSTGLTPNCPCYALAARDDVEPPELYAGGWFIEAGGSPANNIARWDGQQWYPLSSGTAGQYPMVHALTLFDSADGPQLHLGGEFATAGGTVASAIARWDGEAFWPLADGLGSPLWPGPCVYGFATMGDDAAPTLYAVGRFHTAGRFKASHIARWDCGESGCAGDYDGNGTVDLDDFPLFSCCMSGPDMTYPPGDFCLVGDSDADLDVDAADFAVFQRCFTQSESAAAP